MTIANGHTSESTIAESLQEEATVGYKPSIPLESMWLAGAGDFPQITLRRDIVFMMIHPIVSISMEYYKSGIAGAEFWGGPDPADSTGQMGIPISPDQQVSDFVLDHVYRFWQDGVPLLQEGGYPYGWAAGEHVYEETGGKMVWSRLKDVHPNDAFILTLRHVPIGVRIKNIRDKQPVDLWFSEGHIPAKAAWYPHRPRFNTFYGTSQLIGAWLPWRMIGWRDGMDQVVNAAVYRAGYRGPIVRHPLEDAQTAKIGIPATQNDSSGNPRRNSRDVARQIVEWAKAGAGFTLSSAKYPAAQGGDYKWDVDWPDHVMDVRPLIDAVRWGEERIMLGIGVPPELVRAGGVGSGYSGRSIPREAFLDGQQRIADNMLRIFVNQVVRPLVLWNFGDVPFNVTCKSLLKTYTMDSQGVGGGNPQSDVNMNRSQAAKDAWARKLSAQGRPPSDYMQDKYGLTKQGSPAMSLDDYVKSRAAGIIRVIMSRRAA